MPTDHPSVDSPIIRTGSDGRLQYTPDQRQALLEAFDRGGMSALSFTRQHVIQYQTFIAWVLKRRESMSKPHPSKPTFAEVLLEQPPGGTPAASLRIVLPCGTAIEIGSRAALPLAAELLSTLRCSCSPEACASSSR